MAFPSPDQGPTADNTTPTAEQAEDKFLGQMAQNTGADKVDAGKTVSTTVQNLTDKTK